MPDIANAITDAAMANEWSRNQAYSCCTANIVAMRPNNVNH